MTLLLDCIRSLTLSSRKYVAFGQDKHTMAMFSG